MKEIKIQELEERLEMGSWFGGGDVNSCPNCGKGEDADHSQCSCGGSGGGSIDTTTVEPQQPTTTIDSSK